MKLHIQPPSFSGAIDNSLANLNRGLDLQLLEENGKLEIHHPAHGICQRRFEFSMHPAGLLVHEPFVGTYQLTDQQPRTKFEEAV